MKDTHCLILIPEFTLILPAWLGGEWTILPNLRTHGLTTKLYYQLYINLIARIMSKHENTRSYWEG